ncbi:MAG TPA: acyltransferase [Bacteroidia bacterium]|jgi:peptidoglycan/LPS O-acetylase OafA/YrhL
MKKEIKYIEQLDGLRFLAIAGVMISHFVHFENSLLQRFPFGHGVNLFFVISGFLITTILLRNKEEIEIGESSLSKVIKNFYVKRTLRIFPIYYLTIFFLYFINFQNTRDVFGWVATYTTNIYLSLDKPYIGSFNHLWSLAAEEQFYLIWPLLILLTPKRLLAAFIYSTITLSVLFKIILFVTVGWTTAINAFTLSCGDALGLGALIGYWMLYDKSKLDFINKNHWLLGSSAAIFAFFMIFPRPSEVVVMIFGNTLFSIFAFFVVARAAEDKFKGCAKSLLENKAISHLGKISYGIYLYHFFMPDLYNYLAEHSEYIKTLKENKNVFYMIVAILIAQLSWTIIEKPINSLKKRFN